jgi:hypothetical protein
MTLSERVVRWRLVPDGWLDWQDGGFGLLWAVGGLPGRGRHRWWALDLRLGPVGVGLALYRWEEHRAHRRGVRTSADRNAVRGERIPVTGWRGLPVRLCVRHLGLLAGGGMRR